MSAFYDLASLVVVPSGVKAGKVYAQKPMTTDGQLTFSRASTATRVNASGLIETVASNVPRLDYTDSTCPKLLLEPQRTNLVLQSEAFDNAAWTITAGGGTASASVTANYGVSPDGTQNADRIQLNKGNTGYAEIYQLFSTTIGTTYTQTIWLKSLSGTPKINFGFTGSTRGTITLTTEWQRYTLTYVSGGNPNGAALTLFDGFDPTTAQSIDILAWGCMAEAGSYATSYIGPTLGAAVTRGADVIPDQTTTIAQAFTDDSQGTILFDISNVDSSTTGAEARWRFGSSATPLQIAFILESAGLRVFSYNGGFSLTPSNKLDRKIAIRFNGTEIVAFVNGVKQTTYNAATAFDIDQLTSVQTSPATFGLNQFILFPTALSDAQCIELTTL